MQQIINFDIALNYLPYRYRHRSNTRSKRTKVSVQRKSYSRSKIQKDSRMKNIQTSASHFKMNQKSPFSQDFLEGNDNRMKGQDLFAMNHQYFGFDKLQYSRTPSVARRQQQQELQSTPNSQFSFSKELQQPQTSSNMIKVNITEDKMYETDGNEYKPFSIEVMKQSSGNDFCRRDAKEIFNQQDMREIKQALMNKIKQNQFMITDNQASKETILSSSKKQMQHLQQDQAQKEVSLPKEKINFDERYNRLQAINQLSEEHFEKQRKAKIVQIMKKGEKVAQNYYNKHNKRIKDTQQQRLNNFNQNSNKPFHNININGPIINNIVINNSTQVKQSSPKMHLSEEKAFQEKSEKNNKTQFTPSKSNTYNSAKFTEQIKQQSNNYSSLQTSSASQKQQSISSQRPIQSQSYSSYRMMMKKQSSKKLQIKPFMQECIPVQIQRNDAVNYDNIFHKRHLQKTVFEPSRQQLKLVSSQQKQPTISSVLDSFSIPASNNSIKKIKQARSKQKQQLIQRQQISSSNKIENHTGYSHKNMILPNGSNSLHAHPSSANGYAINMKKRKELVKPTQIRNNEYPEKSNIPQSTEGLNNIYPTKVESKMFQIIREDSIQNIGSSEQSYQPKYALKKQAQFIIKIQPQLQDSYTNRYNTPVSCENIQQNIQLSSQGRQQLLEAHLQLCFTPRSHQLQSSPLPSNRASQSQFSLPVSRVLSHQKDSEHKMQDNERILRMMMRDQDIGELSSFMEAEHLSNHQVNSSMTQQLCQIINSHQEQGSNISQNHHEGSNSSQLSESDNKMDDQVEINRYNYNNDEIIEQGSYRINSPQDKYKNFDEQILNVLNMQEFQDEYSQIPSRGMEVSGGSQNACSSSLLAYKGHFHPYSQAIRKFKHSKHNSADVRNKSINSFANTHSQSAKKRVQAPSEASKKTKSRRQMNAIRFKTRMTPN